MRGHDLRLDLRPFDAASASRDEWDALHAFRRREFDQDPDASPLVPDDAFEIDLQPKPFFVTRRWLGWQGGAVIGRVGVTWRGADAPDFVLHARFARLHGVVLEPHRRRGYGRAMLATGIAEMDRQRRPVAMTAAHEPDGMAFLERLGATEKHRTIRSRCRLDALDIALIERWRLEARSAAPELEWSTFAGRLPTDRLEPLIEPLQVMLADAPWGDLSAPPFRFGLEQFDVWHDEIARDGGEFLWVIAKRADQVAALSLMRWNPATPASIDQLFTGVMPAWRGRGLARGVKAASFAFVRACRPEVQVIHTENANVNQRMLAVNRASGFEPVKQYVLYEADVATLARNLRDDV